MFILKYFLSPYLIENLQFKEYLPESIYYIIETSKFYINQKYKLEKSGLYALSVSVTAFLFYCLQRLLNLSAGSRQVALVECPNDNQLNDNVELADELCRTYRKRLEI